MDEIADVLIIGGGPAGLTAATTLMRQRHSVILFDSGSYRNGQVSHMHMLPTWDHRDPADFRSTARKQALNNYDTLQVKQTEVKTVAKKDDGSLFTVTDAAGKAWQGKKLILACGNADVFPNIEGYADVWTRRVFHCLFCHGYEDSVAASTGVLAVDGCAPPPLAMHLAETAANLSKVVTIYTHGSKELGTQLGNMFKGDEPFRVDSRRIKRLILANDHVTLEFIDGSTKDETFLVHNPLTIPKGSFVKELGLATTPMGDVQADAPFHQSSVRGVFAAGDIITPYKVVPAAISSGCNAAVAASAQLGAERWGHQPLL